MCAMLWGIKKAANFWFVALVVCYRQSLSVRWDSFLVGVDLNIFQAIPIDRDASLYKFGVRIFCSSLSFLRAKV